MRLHVIYADRSVSRSLAHKLTQWAHRSGEAGRVGGEGTGAPPGSSSSEVLLRRSIEVTERLGLLIQTVPAPPLVSAVLWANNDLTSLKSVPSSLE